MEFDIIVETPEGLHLLMAEVPNRQYGATVAESLYEQLKNAPPSGFPVRYVWLRDMADPQRPRLLDAWPARWKDYAGWLDSVAAWKASPHGVSGEPGEPDQSGQSEKHPRSVLYHPKRTISFRVPEDRCSDYIATAVVGHAGNNEGYVSPDGTMMLYTLGPCLSETLGLANIESAAAHWGVAFVDNLAEMESPVGTWYTLLDGQCIILVQAANTAPLLLQDKHSSFEHGPSWRDLFPAEVWD